MKVFYETKKLFPQPCSNRLKEDSNRLKEDSNRLKEEVLDQLLYLVTLIVTLCPIVHLIFNLVSGDIAYNMKMMNFQSDENRENVILLFKNITAFIR